MNFAMWAGYFVRHVLTKQSVAALYSSMEARFAVAVRWAHILALSSASMTGREGWPFGVVPCQGTRAHGVRHVSVHTKQHVRAEGSTLLLSCGAHNTHAVYTRPWLDGSRQTYLHPRHELCIFPYRVHTSLRVELACAVNDDVATNSLVVATLVATGRIEAAADNFVVHVQDMSGFEHDDTCSAGDGFVHVLHGRTLVASGVCDVCQQVSGTLRCCALL